MRFDSNLHDSAWLAATVRSLATEVHRLSADGICRDELAALSSQIRAVRSQLEAQPANPLHRWLDGLEQQLDALPAHETACP